MQPSSPIRDTAFEYASTRDSEPASKLDSQRDAQLDHRYQYEDDHDDAHTAAAHGGDEATVSLPSSTRAHVLPWHGIQRLARHRLALVGLVLIVANLLIAFAAPWIAPYAPNAADPSLRLAPVGTAGHWLGMDAQGRDLLSRLIWGGRSAFTIVVPAVFVACLMSLALGLYAGYSRGRLAALTMRGIDILFAFPMILLAINLASTFGPGTFTVAVTVLFSALPYVTRVVYAQVRAERDKEYVEAARALGATVFDIATREILPNVLTSVVVYGTTLVGGMVVFLAGLSFLGLGIQPPAADWGRMVSEGAQVMLLGSAHVATLPALAIVVLALAFNWLGDGLRDAMDAHS